MTSGGGQGGHGPGAALWGGRFEGEADPLFREFNDSLRFDYRLARHDIEGSIAWARALGRAGVLTDGEVESLTTSLGELRERVKENPRLPLESREEDIHSWIERELIKKLGPLGKKLHTGRSRNDQVATDLHLYMDEACGERTLEMAGLARALVDLAEREVETVMPGYTHLQRAQPILFAHWALAYANMLSRDRARLDDLRRRLSDEKGCPLGSAALAGTTYPIDRHALADDLRCRAPSPNSLDAVGSRDCVAELLSAAAICAVNLSRMAEDLILYTTQEFALVEMDDSVTSGSSLMPQKKNPDAMELIRGKAGRIVGALTGLLVTSKGLPLAYNKDLQEDKEGLFDAMDNLSMCLRMATRVIAGVKVNREACREAALGGYSNATELADYLVGKGIPFRDAHELTGRIVRRAIELKARLEALPLDELKKFSDVIGPDVVGALTLEAGLARREVFGGTGPGAVRDAIATARQRL
ncbi:MAG: argininosuccinate lyase [Phycisphaerales bacterium]|nr:argininosuccinate lyase [Phycisphaerales bacterium]